MTNTCATCDKPISKGKHTHCRPCYDATRATSARRKTCAYCDAPIRLSHATLCRSCSQSLRFARARATQLTPEQKHAIAKTGVQSLRKYGRVKIRFLQAHKELTQ